MPRLAAPLVCLWVGLLAASPTSVAPQKNWLQLTTPNFRVIGGAGEGALRRVASRLEQFREALGLLFPKAVLVSSVPTTVIVFRGAKEYEPFTPLYNGKHKAIAGYFLPGPTVNYVTLAAGGAEDFGIIYHEYVHLVMNNTMRGVPLWFNEGLAEYYATFQVTAGGREASLGLLQSQHVLLLREQWLALPVLVGVGHDSPYYNERDKMSVFYAESWALVHYLVLGHEGKYAKNVRTFVEALADGKPLDEACTTAFGITGATLERELRSYVQGERFFHQNAPLTSRIVAIEKVPIAPLEPARAHAALGDLLFRMQRPEEARAQIDAALALTPSLPEAHAALGRLLLAAGDKQAAMAHLEQAAAAPDAPWSAQFEYASLLVDARSAGASASDGDAVIERSLRRTIELQPSFPEAYAQLGWIRSLSPAGYEEAIGLVKRALELSPGTERFWLLLAGVYGSGGDWASVRAITSRLSAATDDTVRGQAATLLATATSALERERQSPVRKTASAAGTEAGAAPDQVNAASNQSSAPGPQNSGPQGFIPQFRTPAAGEQRVSGTLTEIRCAGRGPIRFVVRGPDAALRLETPTFDAVEFISYRPDLSGRIECGPQQNPVVIVTYTPAADGGAARVVAVEFVPKGYEPK